MTDAVEDHEGTVSTVGRTNHEGTVSTGGRAIANFRFAYDIDGFAGEKEKLSKLIERLDKAYTAYGHSNPVLLQWHVKDPGHSAKSTGGWLHLIMHTPLTQ